MELDLSIVDMNELKETQFATLRESKVSERQEVLGKSFAESIEDWETAPRDRILGLCFLSEDQPVGLALFSRPQQFSEPPVPTASIHGLKIAAPWQGRGWGHLAFRLAIDQLQRSWPEIETLKLSVDAENTAAIAVYRTFGMNDSGPVFQGPNGLEHRMEVSLRS